MGLPADGGPSLAGCAALAIALAWGAGWLDWRGALFLSLLVAWAKARDWRRRAATERLANRIAGPGEPRRLYKSLHKIAERLAAVDHRFAQRHPVTGLAVREQLFAEIGRDIAKGEEPLMLGVLRFASFDRLAGFDPAIAEAALAAIASRLSEALRRDHFIAQIDRDCFALWLRRAEDVQALIAEFRALAFVAEQEVEAGGGVLRPTIEAAVACFPDDGRTPASLLARAIAGLAPPGPAGRIEPVRAPAEDARERFIIERDLAHAVDAGELVLLFQPVIDVVAGRIAGAEALLRWTHGELGPVSPARFIPIVETMGLSDLYGMWVLNAAAREARRWRDEGLEDLRIAVNLSARQLLDPDLATKIRRTIERHRIDPAMLELELTETAAMADADHTARVFAELRAAGITLAIDDFGAGYSSLSYLKNLPFDKLKIDREFVTDVQHRRDSRAICRALVELGRGLDLKVVAEGVECAEEVRAMRDLGCRLFQGYHFARPMTGEAFRALARDGEWLRPLVHPIHGQIGRLEGRLSA